MNRGRKTHLCREVVSKNSHCKLTLPKRLLIDRRRDRPLLKVRRHLSEKIRRDEPHLAGESSRAQRTANGQAIHGIYVKADDRRRPPQQIERLLEALVLVLVALDDRRDLASWAVLGKCF